jgi:hypothetical protein
MTTRAAGVRQLELGPLVRMSARRGLTVSRVGVASSRERQTIARETPNSQLSLSLVPFPRETDSSLPSASIENMAQPRTGSVTGTGASPHSVSLKVLR